MLLAASLVFYGWWSPPYLVLLAAIVAISWAGGLALERWRRAAVLSAVLGLELGLLVYFKYAGFAAQNAQRALASLGVPVTLGVPDIVLPVGISFMIFQGMGYTIDVYRRELHAERSFLFTTLFLSYFPQLVAGPIERAAHLIPQLRRMEGRWFDTADWPRGTFLILKGVFFKFVIADNMAVLVDDVYADPIAAGPADIAAAVLGFSIQIYGDFYGYTLIALGSARLFGIELLQNFAHPYLATSIQEFWRRWHISLSQWFRDYVYIPLGGSRVGRARHAGNLLIVMLAVGLWHGASWMFVLWGALHGAMLAVHAAWRRSAGAILPRTGAAGPVAGWTATFILVTLAWIPFRSGSVETCLVVLQKLGEWAASPWSFAMTMYGAPYYVAVFAVFVVAELADAFLTLDDRFVQLPSPAQAALVFVLCVSTYFAPAVDVSFLYFQF